MGKATHACQHHPEGLKAAAQLTPVVTLMAASQTLPDNTLRSEDLAFSGLMPKTNSHLKGPTLIEPPAHREVSSLHSHGTLPMHQVSILWNQHQEDPTST